MHVRQSRVAITPPGCVPFGRPSARQFPTNTRMPPRIDHAGRVRGSCSGGQAPSR
jgi:hypothetical protein